MSPPSRGRPRGPRCDRFLDSQFGGASDVQAAAGGRHGCQGRQFVDERGHLGRGQNEGSQAPAPHADSAAGLAEGHRIDLAGHLGAGALEDIEEGGPRGIQAQIHDFEVGSRQGGGSHRPERRRRYVPWNRARDCRARLISSDSYGVGGLFDRYAKRRDGPLRMITCGDRFMNPGHVLGLQARQQDGALDLRARHRRREVDRGSGVRRGSSSAGSRPRPRTGRPARVSGSMTRFIGRRLSEASPTMVLAKECAARMPDINRVVVPELPASSVPCGTCNPRRPAPDDRHCARPRRVAAAGPIVMAAERAQAAERGLAVGAGGVVGELGGAVRERAEQRVAMRNRLVAGHPDAARHASRRRNAGVQGRGHPATITCALATSPRAARGSDAAGFRGLTGQFPCVIHLPRAASPRPVPPA